MNKKTCKRLKENTCNRHDKGSVSRIYEEFLKDSPIAKLEKTCLANKLSKNESLSGN